MRVLILFYVVFMLACNQSADQQATIAQDTVLREPSDEFSKSTDDVDAFLSDETESIRPLVDQFSPKEVYFELVVRSLGPNDTLPKDIRLNYTREEIAYIEKKNAILKPLSNVQLVSLYREVNEGRKVIYGADDREAVIYDVNNLYPVLNRDENPFMRDAKCVVAMIPKANLTKSSAGDYIVRPKGTFKNVYGLCDVEKFGNDPVVAKCTGFAVSPNKIITAGHCVNANNFRGFYFVFDFIVDENGNYYNRIPASKVYEASRFVAGQVRNNEDFAILEVNNPIPGFRIPEIDGNNITASDLFHVIGSPCGIPLKLATNANLRSADHPSFFTITSDTYGGNSGSPVINSETHKVVGILVRGETDFRRINLGNGKCSVSIVCPFNACRGEDVSRTSQFLSFINR